MEYQGARMSDMRLSRSIVGEAEAQAVSRIITDIGYLGMGTEVQALEKDIAAYLGTKPDHITCVNTGTAALHLATLAAVPADSKVLVPSLTYVASFQAIRMAGSEPVACDVLLETGTIDLKDAETRITEKTKAIMPVHYASNPGDLDAVYVFAQKHGLRVIEDAAHAFGNTYKGKKIGSFGDIVCFSFDGIKNITCGEGGAIVSQDPAINEFVRDARLLSVEHDTEKRYAGTRSWNFDVKHIGYRYHMSNIMAAIGRTQLRRLDSEFAPARRTLSRLYREHLANIPDIAFFAANLDEIVPHIQPVRVLNNKKSTLIQYLETKGIPTGMHYKPNHLLSFFGHGRVSLPITEQLADELVTLPLHPGLTPQDVLWICNEITKGLVS